MCIDSVSSRLPTWLVCLFGIVIMRQSLFFYSSVPTALGTPRAREDRFDLILRERTRRPERSSDRTRLPNEFMESLWVNNELQESRLLTDSESDSSHESHSMAGNSFCFSSISNAIEENTEEMLMPKLARLASRATMSFRCFCSRACVAGHITMLVEVLIVADEFIVVARIVFETGW